MRILLCLTLGACSTVENNAVDNNKMIEGKAAEPTAVPSGDPGPPPPELANADLTGLIGGGDAGAPIEAAAPVKLPDAWSGTGILAKRTEATPRGAPSWTKAVAQVVEHDGKRFLVTSGRVQKMLNPALAKSTAEGRARAELARWAQSPTVAGATITAFFTVKDVTYACAELEVPSTWVPGQPFSGATPGAAR